MAAGGVGMMLLVAAIVLALPREKVSAEENVVQLASPPPAEPAESPPMEPPRVPAVAAVSPQPVATANPPNPLPTEQRPLAKLERTPPLKDVKPVEPEPPAPPPAVKVLIKRRRERAEAELVRLVAQAPLLALDRTAARAESTAAARVARAALAAGRTKSEASLALIDGRPDLTGLPLRRGEACRLKPRAATFLDEGSRALRAALAAPDRDTFCSATLQPMPGRSSAPGCVRKPSLC